MAKERAELKPDGWTEALRSWVKEVLLGRARDSLENRRHSARRQLRGPLICKRQGQEKSPAQLIDISGQGLRLQLPNSLQVDEIVKVSAADESGWVGRQRLRCQVRWCQKVDSLYEAGLEYCDNQDNLRLSWIQTALTRHAQLVDKRKYRRVPADFAVQISEPESQHREQGLCLNLGVGGCLLEVPCRLRLHQIVGMNLGPYAQQPLVSLTGQVVGEQPPVHHGRFRYHVKFFPGQENPHYTRLRSLVLALMEELNVYGWHEPEELLE